MFDFKKQLERGKLGEKAVFEHLLAKPNTIYVKDMSEDKTFQPLGIDGMCIYENERTGIYHSMFFDVKTDLHIHKTGNIFLETGCSTEGYDGCLLSTRAEYFLYYDPISGKLYHLPIYPVRERYNKFGMSKKHVSVQNAKGYTTEGVPISVKELEDNILGELVTEEIKKLQIDIDF